MCYVMLMITSFFSAKGKKGGDDDEKDASPGGDSIIPTLPDVKMCAAKAIARCARNSQLLLFCSHCFVVCHTIYRPSASNHKQTKHKKLKTQTMNSLAITITKIQTTQEQQQ